MGSIPPNRTQDGAANRGLYIGFALVFVVFASSAVLSLVNGWAVLRDNEAVDQAEQVLRAQTQVTADIARVESAARGFVVSRRSEFLLEYQTSRSRLLESVRLLRDMSPADHLRIVQLDELSGLIPMRFQQLDTAIRRARIGAPPPKPNDPAALAVLETRHRLDQSLDTIRTAETLRMQDLRAQSAQSVRLASTGLWASALIGALALTGLFFSVRRSFEDARALRMLEQSRSAELEDKVTERTRELSQANRDLEAFSYSVSHDLRAPLRAMHGYASILRKDLRERIGPEEVNMLERIQRNCTKMSELTESLLALFRVGKVDLTVEEVNLSVLATDIAQELEVEYPGVSYRFKIQPGLKAMGDRQMLNRLLVNLLGNAMKFSSKVKEPQIEFFKESTPEGDVFVVSDNGAGFDASQSGLLFEPFHRLHTESEFSGNGVGLAMCRKIVNRHRGVIWLDSQIDHGATVHFRLGLGTAIREPMSLSTVGNPSRDHSG